jgi:hypothetical protein
MLCQYLGVGERKLLQVLSNSIRKVREGGYVKGASSAARENVGFSHPPQLFPAGDAGSAESLLQPDIPRHEFAHALFSIIDLITDLQYGVDDCPPLEPLPTGTSYPQIPNMNLLQPESFR